MPNDDLPRVVENPGGRSIIYGAKHLYSPSGPVQRAEARARGTASAESTLYILASPLLWHGVEELLLSLPPSSHIAAVELDGNLQKIAVEETPRNVKSHPRLHFFTDCSAEEDIRKELISLLYKLGVENFRKAALISLNGGYRLNHRGYTRIQQFLQEEISSFWKNKMTLIHMAPLWIKNIFLNTALYHRHIGSTAPSSDKPVLVVGAGPSAEKIVPLLRREDLRARVYIIAVDTALAPLTECGVHPDAVVIQEGQFYNVYDFIPLPAESAGGTSAPLYWMDLTSSDIIPRLRREPESLPDGSIRFFLTEFFPTRLFSRLGTHSLLPPAVPPLGSVGSTAVELALRNFSGPVYVCGVDFSFYYGKGHMRGATLNLRELIISGRFMPAGSSPVLFPLKSVYSLAPAGGESTDRETAPGKSADREPAAEESIDREPAAGESAGVEQGRPKKIATGTLLTYTETFRNRFSSSQRLFALARSGADLGIPTVSTDSFQKDILRRKLQENSRVSGGDLPMSVQGKNTREKAQVFIEEEIELLKRLYAEGTKRLSCGPSLTGQPGAGHTKAWDRRTDNKGTDRTGTDDTGKAHAGAEYSSSGHSRMGESAKREPLTLEELVREADYLLHHFPDTGYSVPDPLTPGMIKRLLVSAGHYITIVKRALTLLED